MALIQANRESIDDRFSVLGFTIRTENPLFEVALAAHPDLLKAEHSAKRTTRNFFCSRIQSVTHSRHGESIYLVPPDAVARFVGQPRIYFGMATYKEGDRSHPVSVRIPDAGSMYVNLAGLTERGLRRTARGNGPVSYGNGGNGLSWGGDAVVTSTNGGAPKATNGNGAATAAPTTPQPAPYSDGYPDDLWKQAGAPTPPATSGATNGGTSAVSSAPSAGPTGGGSDEPRLVTSQAYRGRQAARPTAKPYAKPFLVEPYDRSSSWWDTLTTQLAHFAKGAMWFLGVADTTQPPYSAICQVRRPDGSAEGAHLGTAFFIGPRLLLTAGHVVDGQSELIIVPGKNGGGISSSTEPFGRFRVTQFRKHGSYGVNGQDNDMGLICVPAANAASASNYFDLVEELLESRPEGVVVSGYAAWWYATSAIEEFVNANIDENRQHAHGGHIRELPTDGTFSYDLQTLAGTSGSPVYWIENGGQPRAHLVGVHVAAHDNTTNLGCRITQEKLRWIRETAAAWGQTLTFSLSAGTTADVGVASDPVDADLHGITTGEPVNGGTPVAAQAYRPRALDAPQPDYPGASRFAPAHPNNFTVGRRRDIPVDRIVIHITAGGPSINGTIAWFQNGDRVLNGRKVFSSAHYVVGRDGEVVQMVRNADSAHHATGYNWRSIGIEHNANKPYAGNRQDLPPTEPQYEASARLVAWLCQQHGLPIDREHIVGHMEASPRDNHDCPSSIWDWDHYMACVQIAASQLAAPAATSQGMRSRRTARAFDVDSEDDPEIYGFCMSEPVNGEVSAVAQSYRARSLDAPQPDYPSASRFAPAHPNNFRVGRKATVDRIVIHITAGGPNINGTIAWVQNGNRVNERTGKPIYSSAHYVVGRDGEVVQMVRNADTAHHASQVNSRSIGIEHNANKPSRGNPRDLPPTEPQYEASARLVAWLCQQFGLPIDREHIVGHMESSPRDNHDCPSSYWDWDHYMACVQSASAALAAPVAQGLAARRAPMRARVRAQDASGSLETFAWPPEMAEANYLAKAFIEAYNTRPSNNRAKDESLSSISLITEALKSESGRDDVGRAILAVSTAAALQFFDQIKDRLPEIFYAEISTDVSNPPPAPSETVTMPRVLPYLSQRVGMFMAWVDAAIQQASFDTAERVAYQKAEWNQMLGMVGAASTMAGIAPGLGTAATFIGLALQGILTAFAPDFDKEYTSFDAAMQAIRAKYKALAAAILEGLIHARLSPNISVDLPLHADVQAYLDAHAAHALRGWQNELAFLGVGSPATGLSLGLQRVPLSRAQEIITPFYDPADPATALTCQADAFSLAREEWFAGVPNTTIFPHSAICLLEMSDSSGNIARGTGFYIGRNRILTCGHNLYGQASVDIIPGKNGQGSGTEPFGRCTVTSSSWRIPASYGGSDPAFDLAVIDNVPIEAPNGWWFPVLEELTQSRPEGVVVCGYSSRSTKVPDLTAAIDGFKQHLHAGYISQLGPGDSTFDYPILTLKRASGSPVYYISDKDGSLKAYIVGVHTGSATEDLNRGCRLTNAKIDWIEGRTTSLALGLRRSRSYAARGLEEAVDEDSLRGIEGPIPDDVATAQSLGARARALNAPSPEYPQAKRFVPAASGNYRASSSARSIERVVIHITDGGANINGTIGWFQNPAAKVSAHYVIGQDGEIVQMVLHNDVAWHARSANRNSIGIEHVANTKGLNPTPAQMCASAALVTWLCDTYAIPVDRTHILGHSEADTATTHTGCPNAVWNWDYYMSLVNSRTCFPPDTATTQAFHARARDGRGRSRSLGSDNPDYGVALIPQPDKNACWAAAMAMLLSFRRNASFSPETLANEVGGSLASSYSWDLLDAVRTRYGFTMIEQPSNTSLYHTPQQWADWLGQYGPLWVVIVGAPHAVVVAGIRGNLADPASVQVKILNPWDTRVAFDNDPIAFNPRNGGYEDWLSFNQFAADFGNMAQPDYGNWRVLHLPQSAASAQSLGMARRRLAPAPASRSFNADAAAAPGESSSPIEPTRVPGTRMSVLRGSAGASRWALDQLEGFSEPAMSGQVVMQSETADVIIDLGAWPAIEGEPSPLPLTVTFRGTKRGAVGDVQVRAGTPANLAYGVDVTARIENDGDIGNLSSVKVGIEYRFTGLAQGAPAARVDLRLLGDGRYERVNRWVNTAQAA
jgi:N-acetyl-anhydromuramyl-L-alanine amidase AmpD/V8-like Glu-specific endopeptidase